MGSKVSKNIVEMTIEIRADDYPKLSKSATTHFWDARKAFNAAVGLGIAEWREMVNAWQIDTVPWESVRVGVQEWWCRTPHDYDNLAVLASPYIDAAVHAGIIPDDGPKYVKEYRLTHYQVPKMTDRCIRITITREGE